MLTDWKAVLRIACFSMSLIVLLSNLSLASAPQYAPGQIIAKFDTQVFGQQFSNQGLISILRFQETATAD